MRNMHFYPQFIWLKLKLTVDRKHGIGRKFSHVTIQTEELGYFKPECIFLIIIHQPVHILTRNIKTVSMSNNMLSLAKKVLIYCTISDSSFQIFNQKGLSIIIEMNAYWLLLLSRGILIRRFSESIHQLYRTPLGGCFWKLLQSQPTAKAFFNFRRHNLRTQTENNTTFSRFWLLHNEVLFFTKINSNQEKIEI